MGTGPRYGRQDAGNLGPEPLPPVDAVVALAALVDVAPDDPPPLPARASRTPSKERV